MKIGRNDPCHCGSGKKYKKCCLSKDSAPSPAGYRDGLAISDPGERDEEFLTPTVTESNFYEPIPDNSEEENPIVEKWWEEYESMEDADIIRAHIEKFMQNHPQLLVDLGINNEVVFELGGQYRREGRLEEYVDFLLDYRHRFPDAYAESAGYYDSDIIAWLVSQGQFDQVKDYFDAFITDPIEFVDQFFAVLELLTAKDVSEPLMYLVEQVKDEVLNSSEIIGGRELTNVLVSNILPDYLKTGFNSGDIDNFANRIAEALPYEVDRAEISAKWAERFGSILRPYGPWEYKPQWKKGEKEQLYAKISYNFMRYLQENAGISWCSAHYHSFLIYEYAVTCQEENKGKKAKAFFDFREKTIDRVGHKITVQDFFLPNTVKLFSLLNAIHYFASYLEQCGMGDEINRVQVEDETSSLFEATYPAMETHASEALSFREFPVWGQF